MNIPRRAVFGVFHARKSHKKNKKTTKNNELQGYFTLPETNIDIGPENGWLEYYFPVGARPIFRGKLAVSFREGNLMGIS